MAAISVYAKSLGDANDQACQGPDLAGIVVSSEEDKEDDKGLENDNLVAIEEVCASKSLLQAEAVAVEEGCTIFSPTLDAFLRRRASYRAVVYGKKETLEAFGDLVRVCNRIEEDGLEGGNVQHLDEWIDVLLEGVPKLAGLLLQGVQCLHVDIGGAVAEDEALVLCRVAGRFGRVHVIFVVGWLDEDRLEVFDFVVQARPEAVVNVAAPSLLDDEPAEATLKPLYTIVNGNAGIIGICAPVGIGTVGVARAVRLFALDSFLLVFLDLGIQARHNALKAPQSVKQLCILGLAALARGAAWSWEDAFDLGAQAV